ncbi:ROK family protein [Streptococcus cuniculi]|uniref:ROK family protein n=1 Tax=Streptococcus cuniculi TaxID=1432788 RepID=A0A4Y9JBT0_9STRE|nr:ROK family protein [Streptococcus cuniculi]MBF0778626.1 ROK family protein [Streptococcus cuniculi]TFU97409.1 ROK family protein [Streptococcus cuniculi]
MAVRCFDIGGTGVKSALIGQDKILRNKSERPTPDSLDALLGWMKECIQQAPAQAISISFPGAVNPQTGFIEGISAVPYIHGVSWYQLLEEYQLPIFIENDANCVGLSQLAVDQQTSNFLCVVCGTGIGGAVILNRRLMRGPKAYAGEFGCMVIDGLEEPVQNWSQIASTGSLVRYVEKHSPRLDFRWNGRHIFEEAQKGDEICVAAIERMIHNMALGLMNLYYVLDPEIIYIGGGISQNKEWIDRIIKRLEEMTENYEGFPVRPKIAACTYYQDANLMGAYMNSFQ